MTADNRLTVEACRALQAGQTLKDHDVRGLQLRATATGKSWMLYHRAHGIQRKPVLGYFPALSIAQAREAARAMLLDVAKGKDPSGERQELRQAPTVKELSARYLEHKRGRIKPRSFEDIERVLTLYVVPMIGHTRVVDVKMTDVQSVLNAIRERRQTRQQWQRGRREAPGAMNKARENIRGMFNYAVSPLRWITLAEDNPVLGTDRAPTRKRKVHVTAEAFPRLGEALDYFAPQFPAQIAALWCILMAGTRVTELLQTRQEQWHGDYIDLDEHKTDRTGDNRTIWLPRQAMERIAALPVNASGLLFGGIDRYSVYNVWEKVRARGGFPELSPRDFRRTFASVALSRGATLDQIGELFSHKNVQTTQGYAWLMAGDAKRVAQDTADAIEDMTRRAKEC